MARIIALVTISRERTLSRVWWDVAIYIYMKLLFEINIWIRGNKRTLLPTEGRDKADRERENKCTTGSRLKSFEGFRARLAGKKL